MNKKNIIVAIMLFFMLIMPVFAGMLFEKKGLFDNMIVKDEPEKEKIYLTLLDNDTGEKTVIDSEEYIVGALAAEVPYEWDLEALKAMAVAIRSYTLRRYDSEIKSPYHPQCDICTDYSHCLAYVSYDDLCLKTGEEKAEIIYGKMMQAVKETSNQVLKYKGEICDCVFHSSSSCMTESAENVWGMYVPYLVSETTPENAFEESIFFSGDEFSGKLKENGFLGAFDVDKSKWVGEKKINSSGRTEKINICGIDMTGRRIREIFGISSTDFELVYDFYGDGNFVFISKGKGHGVGMSQYGCLEYALQGKKYDEILALYYKDTVLALYEKNLT